MGRDSEAPLVVERLRELRGAELYRRNAFRLTGMSTGAARRAVGRRKQQVAMAAKAGVGAGTGDVLPVPGEVGAEQVRGAFDVLDHPQRRLVDELFWLWGDPEEAGCGCSAQLHRVHDEAVEAHARALDAELAAEQGQLVPNGQGEHQLWKTAAHKWRRLLGGDGLWEHLRHRARTLDDRRLDESAVSDLAAEVRATLVSAVASLARDTRHPEWVARLCAEWSWAGQALGIALEEQLRPLHESLGDDLDRAGRTLQTADPELGPDTEPLAREAAAVLCENALPALARLGAFENCGTTFRIRQLADATALLLNNCAVAMSPETDRSAPSEESLRLLDLALTLEPGDQTRETIRRNRTGLDQARFWVSTVKPQCEQVAKALHSAKKWLEWSPPKPANAADALERTLPRLRHLRTLDPKRLAELPEAKESIDSLSESAAVLLNNCALALVSPVSPPSELTRALQLVRQAQEFTTTAQTRRQLAKNRQELEEVQRTGGYGHQTIDELLYGSGRVRSSYGPTYSGQYRGRRGVGGYRRRPAESFLVKRWDVALFVLGCVITVILWIFDVS